MPVAPRVLARAGAAVGRRPPGRPYLGPEDGQTEAQEEFNDTHCPGPNEKKHKDRKQQQRA